MIEMVEGSYKHLVEYDPATDKIIIHRLFVSGQTHLYTEIPMSQIKSEQRTLKDIGRILGEALVLDMSQFRDSLVG